MGESSEQSREASPTEGKSSFGHLLVVWFLVGSSFWFLGFSLVDAIPAAIPLSRMGAGLLLGTVVVVLLWSIGWRPSLPASAGYFVAEGVFELLLLGINVIFSRKWTPWMEVGLHTTSITLAAALVFTNKGKRIRNRIRGRIRILLKLPSEDRSKGRG